MPLMGTPKRETPVSLPAGASETMPMISATIVSGRTSVRVVCIYSGLPSSIEVCDVFGGDEQGVCERAQPRYPRPDDAQPAIADPVMRFGTRIHIYGRFLLRIAVFMRLNPHLIDASGALAPESPLKADQPVAGECNELRKVVGHQNAFSFPSGFSNH